jgi:hypothetical protein
MFFIICLLCIFDLVNLSEAIPSKFKNIFREKIIENVTDIVLVQVNLTNTIPVVVSNFSKMVAPNRDIYNKFLDTLFQNGSQSDFSHNILVNGLRPGGDEAPSGRGDEQIKFAQPDGVWALIPVSWTDFFKGDCPFNAIFANLFSIGF